MPEVDLLANNAEGLAVALGVGMVQPGMAFERLHDRPADQMRVGNFALADQGAVLVDDAAVFVDNFDGDGALRGSQRHGQAGFHVLSHPGRCAAQRDKLFRGSQFDRGRRRRAFRRRAFRHRSISGRGMLLEDRLPTLVDRSAVVQVLLIELVLEPAVDIHFGVQGLSYL